MKSSTGEKEFFSVFPFASEGKTDEVKEFTIAERTVKVCLLHFRLEYLRKCVTDRIYFQVGVIWLNAFTGFSLVQRSRLRQNSGSMEFAETNGSE